MELYIHLETPVAISVIAALFRLWYAHTMPKRKPTKDDNTAIVRAVERVTGSGKVKGEDLLPPRLAEQLRDAKARLKDLKNGK